ncbi:DUF3574 domain-containing protein [Pseudonocardia acaciae]|uniref:DUF3574 domain-containing protein n=1 Tax=Pseudonocardia acaciae TaxID=551276 RepID=UPI00048CC2A5|nr:DUF3574 domain-containing protein [Pseudonocardia acaciae]
MLPFASPVRAAVLGATLLIALTGCATSAAAPPATPPAANPAPPGCEPYARTELFFGTTRAGGPPISDQEFHAFLDSEVTPRFPDGLTLLSGYGQFRGSDGKLAREQAMVLVLLYPKSAGTQPGVKIDEIRQLYRQKFNQESVLRADDATPPCVSF